jgi:hypothetical protein
MPATLTYNVCLSDDCRNCRHCEAQADAVVLKVRVREQEANVFVDKGARGQRVFGVRVKEREAKVFVEAAVPIAEG